MVGTIELISVLSTKHFLGNLEDLLSHDFIDYYKYITSTSAASMSPIKLSNKGFSADNAMKYHRHSVLR